MAYSSPNHHSNSPGRRHESKRSVGRNELTPRRSRPSSSYHAPPFDTNFRTHSIRSSRNSHTSYHESQYRVTSHHRSSGRSGSERRVASRPHDQQGAATSKRRSHRRQESGDYYRYPERLRTTSGQPLVSKNDHVHRHRSRQDKSSCDNEKQPSHRPRRRRPWWRRWWWLILMIVLTLLVLIIGLAAGLSNKNKPQNNAGAHSGSSQAPSNSSLSSLSESSIPQEARGTYLDPFTWYDTTDFNLTYTPVKVGGLSIMGLNGSWNDGTRPNPYVPPLDEPWDYGHRPIRGMNLGGWLSTEPFITPSIFNNTSQGVPAFVDEYTLSMSLGSQQAKVLFEQHYAGFVRRSTFSDIRAAGFDHVRLGFPYWAIQTFPGDPYVPNVSWRYLLRGIEWARSEGLRVCLDLHSAPGSQNGNDHSGRRGVIGWLNGTQSGQVNADRTLDIHSQLSAFFAQPRYKNIITMYGVLNEPRMVNLNAEDVFNWTSVAIDQLRASTLPSSTILVVSNGFLPLPTWHGALPNVKDAASSRILLDAHQYVIFNSDQLALNHSAKLEFACNGWAQQAKASSDPEDGFGTFLCGEWSQADTDCGGWVNGVGRGNRWTGTLDMGNPDTSVLQPACPLSNGQNGGSCDCGPATAEPSSYKPAYKSWLKQFAEAQVRSFELGWGWFYWTWQTEGGQGTVQWSWNGGMEAGILPKDVSDAGRGGFWQCNSVGSQDWVGLGLDETY